MKKLNIFALLLSLVILVLVQACENKTKREEVREEYREAGQATQEYFDQERDSVVKDMREQKARIDARLEKTRAEARAAKGEAKRKAEIQIDKLDSLSRRAGDKIEEARAANRERWTETKKDIKEAADELEAEWNDLITDDEEQ